MTDWVSGWTDPRIYYGLGVSIHYMFALENQSSFKSFNVIFYCFPGKKHLNSIKLKITLKAFIQRTNARRNFLLNLHYIFRYFQSP